MPSIYGKHSIYSISVITTVLIQTHLARLFLNALAVAAWSYGAGDGTDDRRKPQILAV